VIDGDTVVVGSVHVRLLGVDASELMTARGEAARLEMIRIVGNSELNCDLIGELSWGREVGICTTSTGIDINQAIVERGYALACPRYSARYLRYQQEMAIAAQKRAKYCLTGGRP
jgi:micrococcal nuclease